MTVRAMLHDLKNGHGVVMEEVFLIMPNVTAKPLPIQGKQKAVNPKTGKPYSKEGFMTDALKRKNPSPIVTNGSPNMPVVMEGQQVQDGLRKMVLGGQNDSRRVVVQWVVPRSSVNS